MCGRYSLDAKAEDLIKYFGVINHLPLKPRYNIAPSQMAPVIRRARAGREVVLMRWGLVPHWAKDAKFGYHTINARAETVDSKPAYRDAFRRRRCLVPATGFFEWRNLGDRKQPYNIRLKDRSLFALAGLWDRWTDPEGKKLQSFTIIVTDANEALRPIHDRMPVILNPGDYDLWLDPEQQNATLLKALLKPLPSYAVASYPVSRRVGSPANDDPGLLEPLPTG